MKRKETLKKILAGVFFIASIMIIVGVVFLLGIEKGFTEPKFQMTAVFNNVGGLTIGAPVRLSGVTVGTVGDIFFLDEERFGRGVAVRLNLYKKYQEQLEKSIRFAIITEGILGDKIVDITSHPRFHRPNLSETVVGVDPLDVQNLAETFGESAVALLETSKAIQDIIHEMKEIATDIERLLGRIEQRIIDGSLFKMF